MAADFKVEFRRRPSALAYHVRAFHPSPGVRGDGDYPFIRATWTRHRVDPRQLAEFLSLTGLRANQHVPMLFPHVFSFPLQMAVLTHPRFPVPIWKVLQVRNRLLQHRPIADDAILDLETVISGQRLLERGVEFDLSTRVSEKQELVWESTNTFYARGRLGGIGASPRPSVGVSSFPGTLAARWRATDAAGWRFAALTGDYNGIHYWSWYARLMGFRRAFLHPQLVLGQCMARLDMPRTSGRERLEAWLRGPVYQRAEVELHTSPTPSGSDFHLMTDGERRPAIIGRWQFGEDADRPIDPVSGATSRGADRAVPDPEADRTSMRTNRE